MYNSDLLSIPDSMMLTHRCTHLPIFILTLLAVLVPVSLWRAASLVTVSILAAFYEVIMPVSGVQVLILSAQWIAWVVSFALKLVCVAILLCRSSVLGGKVYNWCTEILSFKWHGDLQ